MSEKQKYKVIVSDRAKRMLGSHVSFIAKLDKEVAKSKKQQIIKALKSLVMVPQRFPFFNETYIPFNKYHKMYVEKWYLVLYQIKDDTVYVDYILDFRKEYDWLGK